MDLVAVRAALVRFRASCVEARRQGSEDGARAALAPGFDQFRRISEAFGSAPPILMMATTQETAQAYIEHIDILLGTIDTKAETDAMLGPAGPQLSATGFHKWVWDAAAKIWDDGHYRHAVADAYLAVESVAQSRTGARTDGKKLWSDLWSDNEATADVPRLRFPGLEHGTTRWTSQHEGAANVGRACAQLFRNKAAHVGDEWDEQEALEALAMISVLARQVDECEVRTSGK